MQNAAEVKSPALSRGPATLSCPTPMSTAKRVAGDRRETDETMKILVLVKQVPDSTTNIKITADESDIERAGVKMVVNPFDEFAIEQAVRIRESRSDVEQITALIIGPAQAADALRTLLAIGADDAIHLQDQAFDALDELQQAALNPATSFSRLKSSRRPSFFTIWTEESWTASMVVNRCPHAAHSRRRRIPSGLARLSVTFESPKPQCGQRICINL